MQTLPPEQRNALTVKLQHRDYRIEKGTQRWEVSRNDEHAFTMIRNQFGVLFYAFYDLRQTPADLPARLNRMNARSVGVRHSLNHKGVWSMEVWYPLPFEWASFATLLDRWEEEERILQENGDFTAIWL